MFVSEVEFMLHRSRVYATQKAIKPDPRNRKT